MSESPIDIKSLSPEERLSLLAAIRDRVEPEDVPVTDAQRRELDCRLDDLEREGGPGNCP